MYQVYVASCVDGGGIYHYTMNLDGQLTFNKKYQMDKPMYLLDANDQLHFIIRSYYPDDISAYGHYDYLPNGELANISPLQSTLGSCGCHMFVNDRVYLVNYRTGNVVRLPNETVQHVGKGIDPSRQEKPHPHFITGTKDGKYILATDLGLDTVTVYDADLHYVSEAQVPLGHGARHLILNCTESIVYCLNELKSTVTVFSFNQGIIKALNTYQCYEQNCDDNTAAAIRLADHEQTLLVSNRGCEHITAFAIEGEHLKLIAHHDCNGMWPRDFILTTDQKYLLVTNEHSNNLTVFKYKGFGKMEKVTETSLPAPLCVVVRGGINE